MLIKLPFHGFYNSMHESNVDYAIESMFTNDYGDINIPTAFYDEFDYAKAYRQYAELFADQVQDYILNEYGIKVTLRFDSLESPRFYNFETDCIYCHITAHDINVLYALVSMSALTRIAKDRHSSGSGFISSYDPDVSTWGTVNTWDHNQLETLLIAVASYDDMDVMEETHEQVDSIIDDCMNDKCDAMWTQLHTYYSQQHDTFTHDHIAFCNTAIDQAVVLSCLQTTGEIE